MKVEMKGIRVRWPVFATDADSRCALCAGELVQHQASGFPEGKRKGYCLKLGCLAATWYDLAPPPEGSRP